MIIGLTGGIASGKTTVAELFKRKGAVVLDADVIAHRVIQRGSPVYRKVVRYFGTQILNSDGTINRRLLGDIVFSHPERLKRLNSFIHPEVIKVIEREIKKYKKNKVIIIDAPLLIEAGLHQKVDRLVVVSCPRSVQLKRLLEEKALSVKEANLRIDSQMPLREKVKLADEVIDGAGSLKELRKKVNQIWRKFLL